MIKKYKDFLNEGILGKAKELANFRTISKNDLIADKYINMIYTDWEKKKDVIKAFIVQNNGYDIMTYRISDDTDSYAGAGNKNDGDIEIKLTHIKESGWDRDISDGRIEVTVFKPYKGDLVVLGRGLNSGDIINDDDGVKENSSYVNISGKKAKDVISFMKSKFIEKYPDLKSSKNLSYLSVFEVDKDLVKSRKDKYEKKRKEQEEEYHRMQKEASDILNRDSKFDEGYFEDVFLESQEEFGFSMNVVKFLRKDNNVFYSKMFSKYEHISSTTYDGFGYELENDILYVLLGFDTSIKSNKDTVGYNPDEDYYESASSISKADSEIVSILKSKRISSQFELLSIEEIDVIEESVDFGKSIYRLSSKLMSSENTIIALLRQK